MRFAEALRELEARQPESMPEPDLERITRLAELLDHPELTYPTIQLTGTNGKTTTARMVTALACALGLTTGLFVSPHVVSTTERLSVCGESISEEAFAETWAYLRPFLQAVDRFGRPVTYFEALTAMAFAWFADVPVALGVFEVGMGGRWDATNLVRGDVAVICPIGLDHVGILGNTIEGIAGEKSHLIKPGRPAVIRRQRPEAMAVLEARAGEVGADLLVEGAAWDLERRTEALGGQAVTARGLHATYGDVVLPLFGEEMARNAGAAIVAVEALLGRALDERVLREALGGITSPGRVEVVGRRPLVVLDGAHNLDAAASLAEALGAFARERLHLVAGMFADKDVEGVAGILAPLAARAYACAPRGPRAAPAERVAAALGAAGVPEVEAFGSVVEAVRAALAAAAEDDLILVTGSFYTVAEARPAFVAG